MAVDPVDDCTFWYTQEYYATTGTFNWRTRIGSFKFPVCTSGGATPTPTYTYTPVAGSPTPTPGGDAYLELVPDTNTAGSPIAAAATPPTAPFDALVKVRYKAPLAQAQVTPLPDGRAEGRLAQPRRGITPGQAAVC